MSADKSALGTLPAAALQYCEPVRTASALGWYVFPPMELLLRWTGSDVFLRDGDGWVECKSLVDVELAERWDAACPDALRGRVPPVVSRFPSRNIIQVWSGLLVTAAQGWGLLIRGLVNVPHTAQYRVFEGYVEADEYGPFPLFVNIQLLDTAADVRIDRLAPMFQVIPLDKNSLSSAARESELTDAFSAEPGGGLTPAQWAQVQRTIRDVDPTVGKTTGTYSVEARRRSRDD